MSLCTKQVWGGICVQCMFKVQSACAVKEVHVFMHIDERYSRFCYCWVYEYIVHWTTINGNHI